MKIVGLITEYNPFHNGHKYHIEEAKRITGADYVIAVMSGNFVQSLVCTDGFMENIYTYIFMPNHQVECFNRSKFLPFCMSLISQ